MIIIMGMTWKELLRKRVMLLTLLLTIIFLVLFWFIARTLGHEADIGYDSKSIEGIMSQFARGSFILTLGFFFGSFVIAFLAIFSSFSAIAGEAEQGVLQALLPRPIPRWKWYAGRWLGYVSLCVLFALVLFSAILVITDIHAAIPREPIALLESFLLFASAVPLLVTVSMLGSGIFSALGNGVFLTMLYGAGWLGGMIEKMTGGMRLDDKIVHTLTNISGSMSLVMPADALQRKMLAVLLSLDDLQGIVSLDSGPLGLFNQGNVPSASFVLYAALYTAAAFIIGMLRFGRKDL